MTDEFDLTNTEQSLFVRKFTERVHCPMKRNDVSTDLWEIVLFVSSLSLFLFLSLSLSLSQYLENKRRARSLKI